MNKPRIAHLAGPNATIQNTPPLVTSNKARARYGLPPIKDANDAVPRFDALRAQRLAAPAKVYVEQFSAHPLEADAAELYGPPDGYLDEGGRFHKTRQGPADKPVYEIEIRPEDGLYPLPYMARQADGQAWEEECASPGAPQERARQPFFPDGSRSFEEIDRLHLEADGLNNVISTKADVDFYRVLPPSGYKKGLPAGRRTDIGEGDIPPETHGVDFFPYKPYHLHAAPARGGLARAANAVQRILGSGKYAGAVWTEGSPTVEETIYWLNLLVDTTLPLAGNSAQRMQNRIGNDGPKNIVDSIEYLASRVWADAEGRNRAGFVVIQEQRVFAARAVMKVDARPGGYAATGGHGGVLGAAGHDGRPLLHYLPTALHTYLSQVNITRLPREVQGIRRAARGFEPVSVPIKNAQGELLESAVPKVSIVKDGSYTDDEPGLNMEREVDLHALIDYKLQNTPLAGFVIEGWTPYGMLPSAARDRLMRRALHCGLPVVRTGRGNTEGFVPVRPPFIAGSNLTSTKARLLLMAAIMKFGALPAAADPDRPTAAESEALRRKVAEYQSVFDTH